MIGISLGIGIELGNGMLAQPDKIRLRTDKITANITILGLSCNLKVSPVDLYD